MPPFAHATAAPRYPLTAEDILVLVATTNEPSRLRRAALLQSTWLASTRSLFFSDVPTSMGGRLTLANGVRGVPQYNYGVRGVDWAARTPADYKPLHALLDANRTHGGTFKWLVLIDDDTTLRVPALLRRLGEADSERPLLLGTPLLEDDIQYDDSCMTAKRRLGACRVARPKCTQRPVSVAESPLPAACRVQHRTRHHDGRPANKCRNRCFCPVSAVGDGRYRLDEESGHTDVVPAEVFPYGGFGYAVSAGLMRAIDGSRLERCLRRLVCGPSDFRLTACIKSVAGFGMGLMPFSDHLTKTLEVPDLLRAACARDDKCSGVRLATLSSNPPPDESRREAHTTVVTALRRRLIAAVRADFEIDGSRRQGMWRDSFHRGSDAEICLLYEALTGNGSCAALVAARPTDGRWMHQWARFLQADRNRSRVQVLEKLQPAEQNGWVVYTGASRAQSGHGHGFTQTWAKTA